jgi:hypothetical protein
MDNKTRQEALALVNALRRLLDSLERDEASRPIAGATRPSAESWTIIKSKKGKVPGWVQSMTGLKSKYDHLIAFGEGTNFRRGEDPPKRIA